MISSIRIFMAHLAGSLRCRKPSGIESTYEREVIALSSSLHDPERWFATVN
jgi:hypothetical protein